MIGKAMEEGVKPPEELEKDILLAGKVHSMYGSSGSGKTWVMLRLVEGCIERGERVVVFDNENGRRIVSERLEHLGVDPVQVDELLWYIPMPSMGLSTVDLSTYAEMLEAIDPALIVFDSLIGFLASAGLEENSNDDVARWAVAYCHPARKRGIAVLLIDHVPKDGMSARGAGRKKDEVDVMWRVQQTKPFDRNSVGEITLVREKDREGWLPLSVKFSVGGGAEGFVFARSEGALHETGNLSDKQHRALDVLRAFGAEGARYKDWKDASGLTSSTFDRIKGDLVRLGEARHVDERYHAKPENRNGGSSGGSGLGLLSETPSQPPQEAGGGFPFPEPETTLPPSTPKQPPSGFGGGGDTNPHNPRGSVRPRGGGSPGVAEGADNSDPDPVWPFWSEQSPAREGTEGRNMDPKSSPGRGRPEGELVQGPASPDPADAKVGYVPPGASTDERPKLNPQELNKMFMLLDDPYTPAGKLARAYAREGRAPDDLDALRPIAEAAKQAATGSAAGWETFAYDIGRFIEQELRREEGNVA